MKEETRGARELVLLGSFVHSKTREALDIFHNAAVGVDAHGTIAGIVRGRASVGEYPNAGIFGRSTLMDWLERYTFPLEASLADLTRARRVYGAVIRRTLAHGTTTAAYFATVDVAATNLLADLCLALGQRAFVGRVCMDEPATTRASYRDASAAAGAAATRATIEHVRSIDPAFTLVSPILTPRFAPSCTSAAMRALAALHRETGLPIQTHISENAGEMALVAAQHPSAPGYAHVYDAHGLLTPRTVLAHAVHLSDDEAALVAARGASIAHCPCSNTAITSGTARVRWLWDRGLTVGLGTDVSGGYSPSVLDAARQACLVSRHVAMGVDDDDDDAREAAKLTPEEVLYLATRGGAAVLGLDARVGGFDVGKHWDAQLIGLHDVEEEEEEGGGEQQDDEDQGNVDIFGWESWEDRVAKWLFNGDDRNTKRVWVKGRLVHGRR